MGDGWGSGQREGAWGPWASLVCRGWEESEGCGGAWLGLRGPQNWAGGGRGPQYLSSCPPPQLPLFAPTQAEFSELSLVAQANGTFSVAIEGLRGGTKVVR